MWKDILVASLLANDAIAPCTIAILSTTFRKIKFLWNKRNSSLSEWNWCQYIFTKFYIILSTKKSLRWNNGNDTISFEKRQLWSFTWRKWLFPDKMLALWFYFPLLCEFLFWKFDWFFLLQQENAVFVVDVVSDRIYKLHMENQSRSVCAFFHLTPLIFAQQNNDILCVLNIVVCLEMLVNPHIHTCILVTFFLSFSDLSSCPSLLTFSFLLIFDFNKSNQQHFCYQFSQSHPDSQFNWTLNFTCGKCKCVNAYGQNTKLQNNSNFVSHFKVYHKQNFTCKLGFFSTTFM